MKLSISNIAWNAEQDQKVYGILAENGFEGVELAPTRIFEKLPYEHLREAKEWSNVLRENYGLRVSSIQSIWYGRREKLFGTEEERQILLDYTKKAIDFADIIKCPNLVFGCPRNRYLPKGADPNLAVYFFEELADYALQHNTVLALEANPVLYNTNYINTTVQAFDYTKSINSAGFKVNLDVGALIENGESLEILKGKVGLISHVHISEPGLKLIKRRELHSQLANILRTENYQGYVSVEMERQNDIALIQETCTYLKEVFA